MAKGRIIVGLDMGTTKIATVIAEMRNGDMEPQIIGVGTSPSNGLRRGVVVNLDQTVQSIERALSDAERMANVPVHAVYVGIAGDHIRGINSRGVIAVSRGNRQDHRITKEDVDRVVDQAKAVALPMDREIIHVLPQEYIVDDQTGIKDPIGMAGIRLEAEVHIVTGAVTSAQNICESVRQADVGELQDLVLEPLASSYAVLSPDEKELGVGLLDVGGGTTDIALFFEGSIRHTAVIGLGGSNVTRDMAFGLRTSLEEAERIKIERGYAMASMAQQDEMISIPGVGGRSPREVPHPEVCSIIEARMEEIFTLALREIQRTEYADLLSTGIVLTGGGSMLKGTVELAERVFDCPVQRGYPKGVGGLVDKVAHPIYATGVGLVLYGAQHTGKPIGMDGEGLFKRILGRMKGWFHEYA